MQDTLIELLAARRGHFRFESGHHGDLWLDLELLCLRPRLIERLAKELARQLSGFSVDAVCGPLVEGAFVALMVASELDVEFYYTERFERESDHLFPVEYRIPDAQRARVQGKRLAIVNDVVNAGSAVRGTLADLQTCGAEPVAIGTLLVLGEAAARYAAEKNVPLISIATLPNHLWTPTECPLCASGSPVENLAE